MLYELIGIVRPGKNLAEVRDLVLAVGNLVLRQNGVIRDVKNWGLFSLPKALSAHQMRHRTGLYFAMRFDASSATQQEVRNLLRFDPRMIRHTSVKLGDGKLATMSRMGHIDWKNPMADYR
ncbi:ribosomal protein S6 [Xylaria nigripes]|nr:ribosomal protein S6 [Xylaria nigripes]